jgi:hypothetical protein
MQTITAPAAGQLYTSAAENIAVLIGKIDGAIIQATITELRPKENGGADILKRPVILTGDEWAELARIHGLTLTSQ